MHPTLKPHQKSFVLLSGGIDSTTCLSIALDYHKKHGGTVEAVSIDYGQRHIRETEAAKQICIRAGIKHTILDCKSFLTEKTMLTDKDAAMPEISYDQIEGVSPTYVPFRNGFMLARLAAYAQEYVNYVLTEVIPDLIVKDGIDDNLSNAVEDLCTLYFGAHAEDAKNWAYPDCTPEFVGAMANAIYIGTYRAVRLLTPLGYISKAQVIEWGTKLGATYELSWSCYRGDEWHCGVCPTCRARKEAFHVAEVKDPTLYTR